MSVKVFTVVIRDESHDKRVSFFAGSEELAYGENQYTLEAAFIDAVEKLLAKTEVGNA